VGSSAEPEASDGANQRRYSADNDSTGSQHVSTTVNVRYLRRLNAKITTTSVGTGAGVKL
jgi:hypothetical protein